MNFAPAAPRLQVNDPEITANSERPYEWGQQGLTVVAIDARSPSRNLRAFLVFVSGGISSCVVLSTVG